MTTPNLTRAELLAALTHTHERAITPALFGGRPILIREITARQRLQANAAATAENPDEPDNALYRAMLIQMAVVDEGTGIADATGRIDPRTRSPLLTVEDVLNIADGRDLLVDELVTAISALAALRSEDLFRGGDAADGRKRNTGARTTGAKDAAAQDGSEGSGDADRGGASGGQLVEGTEGTQG